MIVSKVFYRFMEERLFMMESFVRCIVFPCISAEDLFVSVCA
jgi:hypothetical protein